MQADKFFRKILNLQLARYPQLEIQDLYKLVYQAAMGSEHAVSDVMQVHAWLEREVKGLSGGLVEPIADTISTDGRILRINLRPYVAARHDLSVLADAFLRTASEYKGSIVHLKHYWYCIEKMSEEGNLPFPLAKIRKYFVQMDEQGFPAIHHSLKYRKAYRPAYRVILHEFLLLT